MPGAYPSQSSPQYYERDVVPEWPRRSQPPAQENDQVTGRKRLAGRRALHRVVRLIFAVLIGAGGTLAWQSYGEEAKSDGQDQVSGRYDRGCGSLTINRRRR